MYKLIIDFLSNNKDIIIQNPILFIVLSIIMFGLSWSISSWIQKDKMATNEERVKILEIKLQDSEGELQKKNNKIANLEQKLNSQEEATQKYNSFSLSENDIRALEAIRKFEQENPHEPNKFPPAYSVKNLEQDLTMNYGKANEILQKLRRIGFVEYYTDNILTWPTLTIPINETPGGRLSKIGQEFLQNHTTEN